MLEKLSGYRTYLGLGLALGWTVVYLKVPGAKEKIGPDDFLTVLGILGFGSVAALRAAVTKAVADEETK